MSKALPAPPQGKQPVTAAPAQAPAATHAPANAAGPAAAAQAPLAEEVDEGGFMSSIKDWAVNDAPAMLISTIVHTVLFLVLALALGSAVETTQKPKGPEFVATDTESTDQPELQAFDLGDPQYDPSDLDPNLMDKYDPVPQEAEFNDDSPNFEKKGGGTTSTADSNLGGLGLNINASGLGPAAKGGGGFDGGGGFGKSAGKGGDGAGFGGRGAGKRDAISGGGTKNTERAVNAALSWIARHQNPEGSWSIMHNTKACKDGGCNGGGSAKSDVGATAMGLLPFLASGQTHMNKGLYQATVTKGLQYLVRIQKQNGALSPASGHEMYEHGLATIALCEAYGMTQDPKIGYAAQAACDYLVAAQNPQGGWRYKPRAADTDTSVVGWCVMGLKSGVMAGLKVNPEILTKAKTDLEKASSGYKKGKFGYSPGRPATPAMTGAGLLCMQYLGTPRESGQIGEGIEYLMANQPDQKKTNCYYWYYATQVLHNVPGPEWETWNRKMRRILVDTQERGGCKEGSWNPAGDPWGDNGGRLMVTSLSCLTLEVYYRYLPLYKLDKDQADKDLANK
jgi:hypothetical protein